MAQTQNIEHLAAIPLGTCQSSMNFHLPVSQNVAGPFLQFSVEIKIGQYKGKLNDVGMDARTEVNGFWTQISMRSL